MHVQPAGQPVLAKFNHETANVKLRIQIFLSVRDAEGRVACVRLQDNPDAWMLPGENLRLNEDPNDGALRVCRTWFETPLSPKLADVQSYPATGGEDDRWYVLLVYEATAPAGGLKATPDTLEVTFAPVGKAPGPFALDHGSVFARLRP
jgi:ADP-ribose pyrophosphatase YjhB (NUDIX family)